MKIILLLTVFLMTFTSCTTKEIQRSEKTEPSVPHNAMTIGDPDFTQDCASKNHTNISRTLMTSISAIRAVHMNNLQRNPELRCTLWVSFDVMSNGTVREFKIDSTAGIVDELFLEQISSKASQIRFTYVDGTCEPYFSYCWSFRS